MLPFSTTLGQCFLFFFILMSTTHSRAHEKHLSIIPHNTLLFGGVDNVMLDIFAKNERDKHVTWLVLFSPGE